MSVQLFLYEASVHHELLDNLVRMSNFESVVADANIDDFSNSHIEQFIEAIIDKDEDTPYDLQLSTAHYANCQCPCILKTTKHV